MAWMGRRTSDDVRPVTDKADLRRLNETDVGFVHNLDGQVLHRAGCEHLARMSPRRKLHFSDLDEALAYLDADSRRRWERCPACRVPASPAIARGASVQSVEYVPFEPKTEAERTLRQVLRDRLGTLVIPRGHVLAAAYRRPLPPHADVENVLLYNIGGVTVNRAIRRGVRFESAPAVPPIPAYEYSTAQLATEFEHWRDGPPVAEFGDIASRSTKLIDVWWAMRQRRKTYLAADRYAGLFTMRLRVRGPNPLSVERVKGLIDGVVAALEHMPAGASPPGLARYAALLAVPEAKVQAALVDPVGAPMGLNATLLGKRWAPADDRLRAAEVVYVHGPAWTISGSVAGALPA